MHTHGRLSLDARVWEHFLKHVTPLPADGGGSVRTSPNEATVRLSLTRACHHVFLIMQNMKSALRCDCQGGVKSNKAARFPCVPYV